MTITLFILAMLSSLVEWFAVSKGWHKIEYAAKPALMLFLSAWLVLSADVRGPLGWFLLGGLLSLAGDILLMLPNKERWFPFGLGAFLLAHVAYILGFNTPPPPFNPMTIGVAVMVVASALPLIRRIVTGTAQTGQLRLVGPVRVYAAVISLMLFSALLTLFRTDWLSTPAYLVSLGAVLFISSDMLLAWNKFVNPIRHSPLWVMVTYDLGQMALIAGALGQFGK